MKSNDASHQISDRYKLKSSLTVTASQICVCDIQTLCYMSTIILEHVIAL